MQKVDPFVPVRPNPRNTLNRQVEGHRAAQSMREQNTVGGQRHQTPGLRNEGQIGARPRPLPHLQPRTGRAVDGFTVGTPSRVPPKPPARPPQARFHPVQTQNRLQPAPRPYNPPRPSTAAEAFSRTEQQLTAPPRRQSKIRKIAVTLLQIIVLSVLFGFGFLLRSVIVGQIIIILYAIFAFTFRIESRTTFIFVLISFVVVLTASLRSDTALASVFAVYAFLLLIVGTISLSREVRNEV